MPGYSLDINPLPSVNPTGAPSGDFEHIQANPEMFGGSIARALQGFGGAVEKASDTGFNILEQQRTMQDKTRAAELHSWASDQWSQNSGQFLQLEGKNAVNALPGYKQRNQEILDNIASQAADPYTKLLVQSESRRIMDSHNEMAERHAAAQEKTWQHTTAQLNEASSGNQAVLFATNGDVDTAKRFLFDAGQEARNQADLQGLDRKSADQLVAQKRGQYAYQIVEGLARKEGPGYGPKAALDFYNSERDKIDAGSATKIEAFLHGDLTKIAAQKIGEDRWRQASGGLTNRLSAVRDDAFAALDAKGIPLNVTSGYRSPEHNAAVGGARGSQHLHGNAIDVSLTGLSPQQQQAVVGQFLSDPRVNGFGYYPHSNSIHVDVRQGGRAAWGTDYHGDSIGQGWPSWLTQQVKTWEGGGGASALPSEAEARPYAPPLTPASFSETEPQPAVAAPDIFAPMPRSALPVAIPPTWQEKKAVALAEVMSDPEMAQRPQLRDATIAYINKMAEVEHAAAIDDAAAEKAQEKAAKTASDAAEIEVMQDAYSPHPKVSATQMLSNPRLSREAKERLLKFYPVNEDRDSDLKHYGPGFFDAYKAVHAPVGDPARITDPAKLYEMTGPGGALTIAGVDKLTAEIYKPKNPETEAETEMKKIFLDSARRQVSGEGLVPGMKDPKGEEIFLKFLGYFFPAYDKARKEGKTPGELLDPNSKDYLGKSLNSMKRPMPDWYRDVTADNPQATTGAPAAAAPAKPVFNASSVNSLDQLKAAVKAGTIDYAQGIQIGLQRGWIRENPVASPAPAPLAPPQVPISR